MIFLVIFFSDLFSDFLSDCFSDFLVVLCYILARLSKATSTTHFFAQAIVKKLLKQKNSVGCTV